MELDQTCNRELIWTNSNPEVFQNSQDINLSYDWYSVPTMQPMYQLNPYQYKLIWESPIMENMLTFDGSMFYENCCWPDLTNCPNITDLHSSAIVYNNRDYHYPQYRNPEHFERNTSYVNNNPPMDVPSSYPMVTSYGTIGLLLRHCIRVDLTADGAVYLKNFPAKCTVAMNSIGDKTSIIHPNGKILQTGQTVHIETGNRMAKIAKRGITFTSLNHSLVYLVSASGTKSTAERLHSLNYDIASTVFWKNKSFSQSGNDQHLNNLAEAANYSSYRNGDQVWTIGGVRIKQNKWGNVRVSRECDKMIICTSPTIRTVSVTTPLIHSVIGCDPHR